jgi:hypothetical protein
MRTFGTFDDIDDLMLFNAQRGFHYFDPPTMRSFGSRVGKKVYGGCVFTESVDNYNRTSKVYRVKVAMSDGSIKTFDSDCGSSSRARKIAMKLGESIERGTTTFNYDTYEFETDL